MWSQLTSCKLFNPAVVAPLSGTAVVALGLTDPKKKTNKKKIAGWFIINYACNRFGVPFL